jgi:hypothetical protein
MIVYNGWGATVFKLFAIMFKFRPCKSFLFSLRPSHVIVLGCFTSVSVLAIHTVLTGVVSCNLVAMRPTIVINRRRERVAVTAVIALLIEKISNVLQCLIILFQLLC